MIKVCGMRDAANIAEVARSGPDFMGFIFCKRSPRHAGNLAPETLDTLLPETRRVGVFVDASHEEVMATVSKYSLDFVQLHGVELPAMCAEVRACGVGVIKAFGIGGREDVEHAADYAGVCDYFLFDTRTEGHGGSGRKFDHSLLAAYTGATPYLLSGGIGPEDALPLADFTADPRCAGFDINSRFETAPGMKDPAAIEQFIKTTKQ